MTAIGYPRLSDLRSQTLPRHSRFHWADTNNRLPYDQNTIRIHTARAQEQPPQGECQWWQDPQQFLRRS